MRLISAFMAITPFHTPCAEKFVVRIGDVKLSYSYYKLLSMFYIIILQEK